MFRIWWKCVHVHRWRIDFAPCFITLTSRVSPISAETKIRIYHVSLTNMTTTLIRFLLLLSTIKVAEKAVRPEIFSAKFHGFFLTAKIQKERWKFLKFFLAWNLFDVCSFFFFKKRKIFVEESILLSSSLFLILKKNGIETK